MTATDNPTAQHDATISRLVDQHEIAMARLLKLKESDIAYCRRLINLLNPAEKMRDSQAFIEKLEGTFRAAEQSIANLRRGFQRPKA